MSEEKTIAITMSEAMWEDLVAALGRAGLDAPGEPSRLEEAGPLKAPYPRLTLGLEEDAAGLN
jgi:hypothetical protein